MGKYLKLVTERKLADLLKNVKDKKNLEASGVVVRAKDILVVMDCMKGIGCLKGQNKKDPLGKGKIVGSQEKNVGYEAITQDPKTGHLFQMVEARKHGNKNHAKLVERDAGFDPICKEWLDFDLPSDNKGFEGAAVVRLKGDLFLLALCEGNHCEGGKKGRDKGHGLIQVFKRKKNSWKHTDRIKLPKEVDFEDYADIAVRGKNVAIVSQASSALWVGTISLSSLKISRKGQVYKFPLNKSDKRVYCNVEGVDWLSEDRIIVVSDRMKAKDQPGRCAKKDKSIHIMRIPG